MTATKGKRKLARESLLASARPNAEWFDEQRRKQAADSIPPTTEPAATVEYCAECSRKGHVCPDCKRQGNYLPAEPVGGEAGYKPIHTPVFTQADLDAARNHDQRVIRELREALIGLLDCETNLNGCSGIKLLDAVDAAKRALAIEKGKQ